MIDRSESLETQDTYEVQLAEMTIELSAVTR